MSVEFVRKAMLNVEAFLHIILYIDNMILHNVHAIIIKWRMQSLNNLEIKSLIFDVLFY